MNITLPRATVEQALEALEYFRDTAICAADTDTANETIPILRAALAQQAEPVAAERERCAEYLMQQAAECREDSPTRVTLESCAAVLRLGLVWWVEQQAEPVEPVGTFLVTGNEFCGAPPAPYATWGDALASMFAAGTVQGLRISALAQQAEPVEPVAWAFRHSDGTYHDPSVTEHSAGMVPLYTAPPKRKLLTDEEIKRLWYDNGAGIELSRFSSIARAVERALEEEKNRGR